MGDNDILLFHLLLGRNTVGYNDVFYLSIPPSSYPSIYLFLYLLICVVGVGRKGYNASEGEYWDFGLWQCCRNDGFCIVTRLARK